MDGVQSMFQCFQDVLIMYLWGLVVLAGSFYIWDSSINPQRIKDPAWSVIPTVFCCDFAWIESQFFQLLVSRTKTVIPIIPTIPNFLLECFWVAGK